MVDSATANVSGYLDANTSVLVTVLGLIRLAFVICNLVLRLRLTARLKAKESSVLDE